MPRFLTSRAGWPTTIIGFGVSLAGLASAAQADPGSILLADQHAPAGEIMVGFRYAGSFAGGDILNSGNSARDQDVIDNGCSPHACAMKPTDMTMNMYMLDLMYAPTNWLTLMVMPMWMSHEMTMGPLEGVMPAGHDDHGGMDGMDMDGHGQHMGSHSHGTQRWGDTTSRPTACSPITACNWAPARGTSCRVSPTPAAPIA
jgi:hypothetical protein